MSAIQKEFDAIVVGSGVSGGWAAKELTERGLKTLLLERGRDIKHVTDYTTATNDPWQAPYRGRTSLEQSANYSNDPARGNRYGNSDANGFFLSETKHPYIQEKTFFWTRAYGTGGRSLLWGRQSYRFNEQDFLANAKEGIAIDWPIRYADLAPWYSYAEKFAGISGQKEGLAVLPDGVFLPPHDFTCVEQHFKQKIAQTMGRPVTIGRVAHLTKPTAEHLALGRAQCQNRNRCERGCPFGAYFSTQAATLPAAQRTKRLTFLTDKIVTEILYDETKAKATGVRVLDQNTKEVSEFYAQIIFINAGSVASTAMMLHSKSNRFPNGFGNDSNELGHNVMDHHHNAGASGSIEGFEDKYHFGRRPNGIYVPRYRNWGNDKRDYLRGFGYQGGGGRSGWQRGFDAPGFGANFKEQITQPGSWGMGLGGFGETLPRHENKMYLHPTQRDQWGLPLVVFSAAVGENEHKMRIDMANDAAEMLTAAGFKDITPYNREAIMGMGVHEMGTARMGNDPKSSVLNKWNQVHACKNVFVTDGACMVSSSCVNPSLTYMALTARAAAHAVSELKRKNL
ncbi:MAG: GMC family oxidoreductase [Runella slithyformis]|nr:MAG: GMC family oxidoreductase [Runella slithyformis]TAF93483.1 MAG: GMC family oxidoreductase [Runella sp.]TAG24452.1 MAG: GMC family oxidoreductase [Cytophagales bacterium]TAG35387.1 MAG: GMC family oxidoreductase [Cytophagia bacterium]TAF29269.1 MAG: GMC family oxidoreductase [Runella slithyformis]